MKFVILYTPYSSTRIQQISRPRLMPPLFLDVRWVQHHSDGSTEGLWRQVLLEVGSDNTVVTVGFGDLTPDDSDLGTSDLLGSSVHVGDSLTKVESGILRGMNTVDLNQRGVWVDYALGTLEGQMLSLDVHWMLVYG